MIDVAAAERTLPALLERQAEALGDRPYLRVGDTARTFAGMRDAVARLAGSFAAAGVASGDRVAIMSENRCEVIDSWFACAWLGAILVPINTAMRGSQLQHVLTDSAPRALAIESDLVGHLDVVEQLPPELERIWLLDGAEGTWRGLPVEQFPGPGEAVAAAPVGPGDTVAILYTSGTTGPSKGVMCPQAQFYWWAVSTASMLGGLDENDVLYTCLPLFHTNALNTCMQALIHGSRLHVGPRFSASRFWARLTEADATVTYVLGAMVSILAKTAPTPADSTHRVRVALAPATQAELHDLFRERFGVTIRDGFGMTETNAVIGARDGEQRPGTMGRAMPGYDVKIFDENDEEVPDGTPGELVMRADEAYAFATGYWRLPEKTVESWRNLWFHSGDRAVRDPDGSFRFLDRMKDAIRRRGENISAWEVEQVLIGHPDIAAAAVVPVPSELGEDDVMACVVPREGAELDPVELIRHCEPRLAYFAVPRYIDVLDALPLTENGKVRKFVLRDRGVTSTAWDREAAGYVLAALSTEAVIAGAAESPYTRHADSEQVTTESLLADAFLRVLDASDIGRDEVDGLGVASFTLAPDHAVDLAWRLGLRPRWLLDDANGGVAGITMLQKAMRAVEAGDASTIVLLAGDRLLREEFAALVDGYNRATRAHLAPIPVDGPNSVFALLTQRHMAATGLGPEDYGRIAVAQRAWAAGNPLAVYREPLTLEEYLSAPLVADPLRRYDCVPVVSGADALIVTSRARAPRGVRIKALRALHNPDGQESDGLSTGLAQLADELWATAGTGPADVDLAWVYDDYPAMVVVQLADLGFFEDVDPALFLAERIGRDRFPLNTSGGQLSAGQAGAAGGMHGLVEAVTQLRGEAGARQVADARTAVVTGYGMVVYRYGACAAAAVLEGGR